MNELGKIDEGQAKDADPKDYSYLCWGVMKKFHLCDAVVRAECCWKEGIKRNLGSYIGEVIRTTPSARRREMTR